MLRISWLFCIFRYSPANKVWNPKRVKFPNKDMAKIQNISEIHPTLGFTEFDIIEKYRKSFHESELGRLHSVFPFERMAKTMGLSEQRLGRRNILYLSHIFVGIFPPFWLPNLIFGGISKDTKKPTNSQYIVYELVG